MKAKEGRKLEKERAYVKIFCYYCTYFCSWGGSLILMGSYLITSFLLNSFLKFLMFFAFTVSSFNVVHSSPTYVIEVSLHVLSDSSQV